MTFLVFLLLQGKVTQLGRAKRELKSDLDQLKNELDKQREYRQEQEKRVGGCTPIPHF